MEDPNITDVEGGILLLRIRRASGIGVARIWPLRARGSGVSGVPGVPPPGFRVLSQLELPNILLVLSSAQKVAGEYEGKIFEAKKRKDKNYQPIFWVFGGAFLVFSKHRAVGTLESIDLPASNPSLLK